MGGGPPALQGLGWTDSISPAFRVAWRPRPVLCSSVYMVFCHMHTEMSMRCMWQHMAICGIFTCQVTGPAETCREGCLCLFPA